MDLNRETFGAITVHYDQPIGNPLDGLFKGVFRSLGTVMRTVNVAVKIIRKIDFKDYEKRIEREVIGLDKNNTITNVIKFYGIENPPESINYYIAYEDFECSLKDLNNDVENINFNINVISILRDAVNGLFYIHKNNMTHRDIHPENIFICNVNFERVGKISNLGLSKEFKPYRDNQTLSQEFKANGFIAPELCDFKGPYINGIDKAVDIFSMGAVIFYALTGGEFLFSQHNTKMQDNIKNSKFVPKIYTLEESNVLLQWQIEFAKQLVTSMVIRNPNLRPTAENVKKHPLFWRNEEIANFFESVSAYVSGDKDLRDMIDGSPSNYDCWDINLNETMKEFILKGARCGARKTFNNDGASNLLRFIRNLLAHCKDRNQDDIRRFLGSHDNVIPYILDTFPDFLFYVYEKMEYFKGVSTLKTFYCDYNFST